MTTETRRAEIQARVEKATPGPWVCSDRGDGSGSVYAAPDDILPTALIDDSRCPYIRGEIRYEDGVFAAHAREDIPWLLAEVVRLSEAQEALRAVIETWRGYQQFSEAEVNHKVRSKDKTYRATRIAEAATLNVCISELAEAIKDRELARLTAAPEAQPKKEPDA